jgi:hypothetical protein
VANLLVGPLLRYTDETRATVWVETDEPCTVQVLTASRRTFTVEGHHYALVLVEDLEPGVAHPYEVRLDGRAVWPGPGSDFPPSTIRTHRPGQPVRLVFGSCRVTGPHEALPTSVRGFARRERDVDALRAYGLRMRDRPEAELPGALLLLGDQVYADEVSPETEAFSRTRPDRNGAPQGEVADFEEYTRLYREAWTEPVVRWVLSTVPTAMIFDDHDVHDDWNTSSVWVERMRRLPWWNQRIVGGLMAYWLYQHLGNLSPDDLAGDERYAAVLSADDPGAVLRRLAFQADRETRGTRFSYARDLGGTRLLVVDSRCGRVLNGQDDRRMVDDEELAWICEQAGVETDHLLIATTLPFLLPPALHALEAWDEALCAGRWGRAAARLGERLRQGADLEHWAAFDDSWRRLTALLREIGGGRRGRAPASILVLSGDVHHAYVAHLRDPDGLESAVAQVVCSPMRHPMPPLMRLAYRLATSRPVERFTQRLARSAGVPPPPVTWRVDEGPWFDNQIATLTIHGRGARLRLERSLIAGGRPVLDLLLDRELARAPVGHPS